MTLSLNALCPAGGHNVRALAVERLIRDRAGQPRLPSRQRFLRQLTKSLIKRVSRPGNKHAQKAARPREKMPGQKLVKCLILTGFTKPGRQQQQRTEVVFRFSALLRQTDAVSPHPLAQRQRRVAKQHAFFIQPDGAPRRRRQRPRADEQPLPGVRQRFIVFESELRRQAVRDRPGPLTLPAAVAQGGNQRSSLLAARSIATVFRARLRSMLVIHRIPCFILFQHCVQDGQQFSDAGRQCNFFRFSCGNQACIELFNYRVVPRPNQG